MGSNLISSRQKQAMVAIANNMLFNVFTKHFFIVYFLMLWCIDVNCVNSMKASFGDFLGLVHGNLIFLEN